MPFCLEIDSQVSDLLSVSVCDLWDMLEMRSAYIAYRETSQNLLQLGAIPLCTGVSVGTVYVGSGAVRVVGVPGIPTQ